MNDQIQKLLLCLLRLRRDAGIVETNSICHFIVNSLGIPTLRHLRESQYVKELFISWPEYSGNIMFPVPSPQGRSPSAEFALNHDNLWTGEYGASRRRLLDYMIQSVQNDIAETV